MTATTRQALEPPADGLSIGALSRMTGVSVAALRTWESRYEFPVPARLPSGHRRYGPATVDAIAAVVRQQAAGMDLPSAIAGAQAPEGAAGSSVFLEVRRLHPHLQFQRIRSRTLHAVTQALEDECCARAHLPVLFGGFQRRSSYEPRRTRWTDLGRTARAAFVLADLDAPSRTDRPTEVGLRPGSPLLREWFVVCDGADQSALLVATELPGQDGCSPDDREYEAFWTLEPDVVRTASRICAAASLSAGAAAAERAMLHLAPPPTHLADPAQSVQMFNRIVAYLDRSRRDEDR